MAKSPIEIALRAAVLRGAPAAFTLGDCTHFSNVYIESLPQGRWFPVTDDDVDELGSVRWHGGGDGELTLYSDVKILSYRADFLIAGGCQLLAIECDGHDFHERTKQQAAYDKSRDRDFLKIGIPTVRFTGSEIHHSAERCASDVFAIMQSFVDADDRETMRWRDAWALGAAYEKKRIEQIAADSVGVHSEEHF